VPVACDFLIIFLRNENEKSKNCETLSSNETRKMFFAFLLRVFFSGGFFYVSKNPRAFFFSFDVSSFSLFGFLGAEIPLFSGLLGTNGRGDGRTLSRPFARRSGKIGKVGGTLGLTCSRKHKINYEPKSGSKLSAEESFSHSLRRNTAEKGKKSSPSRFPIGLPRALEGAARLLQTAERVRLIGY
jgi:hypothetical protein